MIHATGEAIKKAIITRTKNSLVSNRTIPADDAPSTFRMPISFVRRVVLNDDKPNKPRHEIRIASDARQINNLPNRPSAMYCALNVSSVKEQIIGNPGAKAAHFFSSVLMVCCKLSEETLSVIKVKNQELPAW